MRDRLGQPGGALLGGQQQRLCIARSLVVGVIVTHDMQQAQRVSQQSAFFFAASWCAARGTRDQGERR